MNSSDTAYMQLTKARLAWANRRINEFIAEEDSFLKSTPYQAIPRVEQKGEESHIRYILQVSKESHAGSRELGFLAGDAIHNLRSIIDSLIHTLAIATNSPPRLALEFPKTSDDFTAKYLPKIKNFPIDIQNWISNEQPHNRPNGNSLLHMLTDMWNLDKHRSPAIFASTVPLGMGHTVGLSKAPHFMVTEEGGLDDGDQIAEAILPSHYVTHFNPEFVFHVSFSKTSPAKGKRVSEFLVKACEHIDKEVIPKFNPFL